MRIHDELTVELTPTPINRKTSNNPTEIFENYIETMTNDYNDENVYENKIYKKQSGEEGYFRIFTGGYWKYPCREEGCIKVLSYNHEGKKNGLYCDTHKKDGMINVRNKRCAEEGCKKRSSYNHEGEKTPLYCGTHKKEGMIDVIHKRCNGYLCDTFVKKKYDGYCIRCYIHLFPDKPVSRNFKTKETAVVNHIKQTFPNFNWICDKQVLGGCSKKRPDMYCDFGYQIVSVEIDENQHNTYNSSCESKRCMEISKDFHHRPLIVLRFNPDKYINRDGGLIRSCWSYNSNGISVVSRNKKKEWNNRLETLSTHIDFWTNPKNKSEKTVQIIELFFDGY